MLDVNLCLRMLCYTNFMVVLSSADIFIKIFFFKKISPEHSQSVKWFGSAGPDLGPNCVQTLSVDDKSRR